MRVTFVKPGLVIALLAFCGVLAVGVRINDVRQILAGGALFQTATAEEPAHADAKPQDQPQAEAPSRENEKGKETPPPPSMPTIGDDETSSMSMDFVQKLAERRKEIEQRDKDLDKRESLLRVAEKRVDQKIKEMEILRTQLQAMVNSLSEQQQQQVDNLVKIYETMKPKDAARILETLDMPVLLGVVQRMKPVRTAAVMAEMNSEKAKDITEKLTRQDQLPEVK